MAAVVDIVRERPVLAAGFAASIHVDPLGDDADILLETAVHYPEDTVYILVGVSAAAVGVAAVAVSVAAVADGVDS